MAASVLSTGLKGEGRVATSCNCIIYYDSEPFLIYISLVKAVSHSCSYLKGWKTAGGKVVGEDDGPALGQKL